VESSVSSSVFKFGPFGSGGTISGFVAGEWQGVRDAYELNFKDRLELGSQLVVYHRGVKVVDLCGYSSEQKDYSPETLQCVFSSGKNMEAIAVAMLVDQQRLSYESPVAKHWPEFAQHGKGAITVADVMRHEGCLVSFANPEDSDNFAADTVVSPETVRDVKLLSKVIENAAPNYVGQRAYHAVTRGWIVSMLIHRVDSKQRTLGQFIQDEIAGPLGVNYYCGIPEEKQKDLSFANMTQMSLKYNLTFQILPALSGLGEPKLKNAITTFTKTNPMSRPVVSWLSDPPTPAFNNTTEGRALEICSAGCYANASSMAKVNMVMANGGEFEGVRLMSKEACEASCSQWVRKEDIALAATFDFCQGGFADFTDPVCSHMFEELNAPGFYGWGGWGGSLSIFSPSTQASIACTVNAMESYIIGGKRTCRIMPAILAAIEASEAVITAGGAEAAAAASE
jgi:CubicO group peptidase (beta-lactamase class C family)